MKTMTMTMGLVLVTTTAVAGCSIETAPSAMRRSTASAEAENRPGQEDSSKEFKGQFSKAESAFWEAVRDGDDDARRAAVKQLTADVKKDPTNGYSAFLAGSEPFYEKTTESVRALAAGEPLPQVILQVDEKSADLLDTAVGKLKDPLYLGFAATLLGSARKFTDPAEAERLFEISGKNNLPADRIGRLTFSIIQSDGKKALELLLDVMDHCLDRTVDRDDPPVAEFVARGNDKKLAHRECYSGYLAPHGTEGALFVGADLYAINGKTELAKRLYEGAAQSNTYATWPLKSLNERRRSGAENAKLETMMPVVQCGTCHAK